MPPLEFSHSQPIDNAALQPLNSGAPDCSFAREVQSQVTASMAQPMPGAESMLGMPTVPGAEQAISPLVQMIMRMPGHIGLASSFFEALGNFFLPQTDMLSIFDPTNFGLHLDLSGIMPDHGSLDISLLPHDAPLLDHLGHADLSSAHSLDLASDKLNLSLGGNSHFVADNGSMSVSHASQFNVSGGAAIANPRFEGAGGLVSGPSLSENFNANSLASNNRLFSDGAAISSASRSMMVAGAGAPLGGAAVSAPTMASASITGNGAVSSLNNAASSVGADNVSAHASSANNVSYNVFEKLTGNKDILAAGNVSDSYHSTVGSVGGHDGATADVAHKVAPAHASSNAAGSTAGSDNPGGLQAKSMTLDGTKVDHQVAHSVDHKVEHIADHKVEHKIDHVADHKVEHVADHKAEPVATHSVEHKVDLAASHKGMDTVAHAAKTAPVHGGAADVQSHTVGNIQTSGHPQAIVQTHAPVQTAAAQPALQTAASGVQNGAQNNMELAQGASSGQDQFGQPMQNDAAGSANASGADSNAAGSDATQNNPALEKGATSGQTLDKTATASSAKVYTIRSGDCLWNIAKDQMGDATKWSDIYKMNGDVLGANPSLIRPGVSINLPGTGAESSTLGSVAHYTVKPGDNLWDIAKNQMGDATKWGDLYKANSDIIGSNPSLIQPGQELTINTGAIDPATSQLSSSTGAGASNLAQAPAGMQPGGVPAQGDANLGAMSQNSQAVDSYGNNGSFENQAGSQFENQSGAQFNAHQSAPTPVSMAPAKVMPVQAEPDIIIPPAHAAELSGNGLSPEAANLANLGSDLTQTPKPLVNTSTANDLLSMLNKRK